MTTPKCRHFPFRGLPGISRLDLVTQESTELHKAGSRCLEIKNDGTEVPSFSIAR
jgi:hypothetical protein